MENFKEMFVLFFTGRWKKLFLEPTENGWISFFRYVFVGGSSFVLDFILFMLLQHRGMHYALAQLISFSVGFLFNFFGGRKLIFRNGSAEKAGTGELMAVLVVALLGLGLTELLLYIGVEWFSLHNLLAKAIAAIIALFWNYFARKKIVYRH